MLGRIATSWQAVGPNMEYTGSPIQWATKVVQLALEYGLRLWRYRNKLVHGMDGGVSKVEKQNMMDIIHRLYADLKTDIHHEHKWLFSDHIEGKLQEPYSVQVAWADSVRQLYPKQYTAVCISAGNRAHRQAEIERHKETRMASTGL